MDSFKEQTRDSFDLIAELPDKWDHNRFYHAHILRRLPAAGKRALDVGCGSGEFTLLLAERFDEVTGIDLSPGMIEEASKRHPDPRIEYRLGDIEEMELEYGSFDAIVSIAAMHHTHLDVLLTRLRDALKEGGVLVVLDLYLLRTPVEYALSALAAPLNLVSDLVVHRGRKPARWKRLWKEHWQIDRGALYTSKQVREIAARHLPGFRMRRHLFWRYSLVFVKSRGVSRALASWEQHEKERHITRAVRYLAGKDRRQLTAIRLKKLNRKEFLRGPGAGFMTRRLLYMSGSRPSAATGRRAGPEAPSRECPYCAENVESGSSQCRYCGGKLS